MTKILGIVQLGNPILRRRANEIQSFKGSAVRALVRDMLATCEEYDAQGLAAPQIGLSLRLIIVASKPNPAYPNAQLVAPMALINPHLESVSESRENNWEGCLSIPGIRAPVWRSLEIRVSFRDTGGSKCAETFRGFTARILQHEIDHLDGIVFTDRADLKQLTTEHEYSKLMRRAH